MPTPSWRTNTSVIKQLTENPANFSFTQAVRLLERASVYENRVGNKQLGQNIAVKPVGRFTPPVSEAIRFLGNPALTFPDSEISTIRKIKSGDAPEYWEVLVNFIGLVGSLGVLPFHYTEMLMQRVKQKDPTMLHFFDLFNHRVTSLFFRASTKYHLPLAYERTKLLESQAGVSDSHSRVLLSLIGLGTKDLTGRQTIRDESLLFYSGLFSQQVKTATGLKQIVQSYFDVPVEVQQFVGQWHDLINDVRTKLPDQQNRTGQNICLGRSTILGRKGWFAQGKTRIVLGPLNQEQYFRFAPGTKNLKALNELVRLYLGMEREYDFIIQVSRKDIPDKISLNKKQPPIIGWSTWLSSKPLSSRENSRIMKIHVSANRLK